MGIHPLGAELFHADGQTNKKKLRGGLSSHICVFFWGGGILIPYFSVNKCICGGSGLIHSVCKSLETRKSTHKT